MRAEQVQSVSAFAPNKILYWADVEICVKKQWHEERCSCRQLRGAVAYAGDICRHIPDSCVACEQLQKSARKQRVTRRIDNNFQRSGAHSRDVFCPP